MNKLFEEADKEVKESLETTVKEIYKQGKLNVAKNAKEIARLTARNEEIEKNLNDLAKAYDAGEFLEVSDVRNFANMQTDTMNATLDKSNYSNSKLRM
jgi:hypothetical protein